MVEPFRRELAVYELLEPFFDPVWYLIQYPEVDGSRADPLEHYILHGEKKGYQPNEVFSPTGYLQTNPDVAQAGAAPFEHYIRFGIFEGRRPCGEIDLDAYTRASGCGSVHEAFEYFINSRFDRAEVLRPFFDEQWYIDNYLEPGTPKTDALAHYIWVGEKLGNQPNSLFDPIGYFNQTDDLVLGMSPFEHFIRHGIEEGRTPGRGMNLRVYAALRGMSDFHEAYKAYVAESKDNIAPPSLTDAVEAAAKLMGDPANIKPNVRVVVGVVISYENNEQIERTLKSTRRALSFCPQAVASISVWDNGNEGKFRQAGDLPDDVKLLSEGRGLGFANGHNRLMRDAFENGADIYITCNPDGAFHPDCIKYLLAMNEAQGGKALIEAIQFPEEHPKIYSPQTLESPWVSGACLMISRDVWNATQGFDPNIFLYCDDVDLSWTVRYCGLKTMVCPRAIFYHDVSQRGYSAWRYKESLISARYMAIKWGSPKFKIWTEQELMINRFVNSLTDLPSYSELKPLRGVSQITDFTRHFSFAPVRW